MPISELHSWFAFYAFKAERERKENQKGNSVNLLDLEPEALAKAFGNG